MNDDYQTYSLLMQKTQSGDTKAFEGLAYHYEKRMLNIAFGITGNIEDSKDIMQDTFLRAFKYVNSFQPKKNILNWLYRININLCCDFMKKRENRAQLFFNYSLYNKSDSYIGNQVLMDFSDILYSCLFVLTGRERIVFIFRDIRGGSIQETAQTLNYTQASVKKLLFTARKKLRNELLKYYPEFRGNGAKKNIEQRKGGRL